MSNKQLRTVIRTVHLAASLLILGLVYVPALRQNPTFLTLVQVIVPLVVISGIAMWQQATINKLRRSRSSGTTNKVQA